MTVRTADGRESLINDICLYVLEASGSGREPQEIKDSLYILLDQYEITARSTELAELPDRNNDLLRHFLMAKTVKGCTEKTIKAYGDGIRRTLDTIGKAADEITAEDIRYYLAVRQVRDKITKVTADNELRYLRSFFQYLTAEELVVKNPTARVERVKQERRKKEALTDIEVEKIRLCVGDERERAVVELLLSTGCRVAELVGIRLTEINGNQILVHGKGNKDRTTYMNAKAVVAVHEYLDKRGDGNPYLFAGGHFEGMGKGKGHAGPEELKSWWKDPRKITGDTHLSTGAVERILRKIAARAGVERANPHKFRRTCATMALRRGMPVEQVSKMLGHESISTTQIYLDLDERDLEQAHRKYVI